MVPNCPYSCKVCPSQRNNDTNHLRPTLSSQLNTGNLTDVFPEVPDVNGTDINMTIPEGVEIQPFEALEPLEVEVVQATGK